jgi:hypothetical protein
MTADPALMIGAATGLVTASAHAFVVVSKELREWRKGGRRQRDASVREIKAQRHDH